MPLQKRKPNSGYLLYKQRKRKTNSVYLKRRQLASKEKRVSEQIFFFYIPVSLQSVRGHSAIMFDRHY